MRRLFLPFFAIIIGVFLSACDVVDPLEEIDITLTSEHAEAELEMEPESPIEVETDVTVTASELDDYIFVHWRHVEMDAVLSDERSFTFPAADDMTLEAVYAEPVAISLESDLDEADLSASPADIVGEGAEVTIEASEVEGYDFIHWYDTVNEEEFATARVHTFEATHDVELEAVYLAEAVHSIIEDFEGDLSHLDAIITTIEESENHSVELNFTMEWETLEGTEEIEATLIQNINEGADLITETILILDMPDLPDVPEPMADEFYIHTIVRETAHFYEAYVDVGLLLDAIHEEEGFDAREIFAFESDFLHLTAPQALVDELEDLFKVLLEEAFADEDFDEELIEEFLNELERFEKYLTLDYYNDLEDLEADIEVLEDEMVRTNVVLPPAALEAIFEDFFKDVYEFGLHFDETEDLPPYEDFIASEEYEQMLAEIEKFGDFEADILLDAAAMDSFTMEVDLLSFFEGFEQEEIDTEFLDNMHFTLAYGTAEAIELPEDARDALDLAEEFLRMAIMVESYYFAEAVHQADHIEAGTHSIADIEAATIPFPMPLMDKDASTIEITADEDREVTLEFYYSSNGASVFADTITRSELIAIDPDRDEPPVDRAAFLEIIEPVEPDNIDMNLIILELVVFVLEEMEDEMDPGNDEEPALPEDDVEGSEDYEGIPRFFGSVITYYSEYYGYTGIEYHTEAAPEDVYAFYMEFLHAEGFEILRTEEDYPNFVVEAAKDDDLFVVIYIDTSWRYDGTTIIELDIYD